MNNIYEKVKGSRFISIAFLVVGVGLTSLYAFPIRSYFVDWIDGPNWYSRFISTLYNFGSRPFFVLGLGLAIFPTFVGRLRWIKYFLGSNIFAVLARLNYTVYMIHWCVIIWMIGDMRQPAYMNMLNEWFLAIGWVWMSFLFAIPVTLIWESPFLNKRFISIRVKLIGSAV